MDRQALAATAWNSFQSYCKDLVMWDERRCLACALPYRPNKPLPRHFDESPAKPSIFECYAREGLCSACLQDLFQKPCSYCALCGHAMSFLSDDSVLCGACLRTPPPWASLRLLGQHTGLLRDLVVRAKFGGNMALLAFLGTLLGTLTAPCDRIIPLPLHKTRLRERGFNQCVELGRACSLISGSPLCLDGLERVVATKHQIGLRDEERRSNVHGAFIAHEEAVYGLDVLLLDDTMTTGATLQQAASALHKVGVASVHIGIITRAQRA